MKRGKTLAAIAGIVLIGITVYIYRTAMAEFQERIPILYIDKCGSDTVGEIFHWSFDDGQKAIAKDASGHGHDGRPGSLAENHNIFLRLPKSLTRFANPDPVDGVAGKALRFNGKNWVDAGNNLCYTTDKFSIAMWFYKDKQRPVVEGDWFVPTLAAKSNWPSTGWWLCTQPNTNNLDMAVSWGPARKHIHSGYEIIPEQWHHVAVTMDNVAHEIVFYIDGKQFGDRHGDVPVWLTNWDQNLYVGDYDGTARWPWFGRIDEVHYVAGVLTAEAVGSLYTKEHPGSKL
jgi:hypothetical protein